MYMRLIPSMHSLDSQKGFTVIELLVTSVLGLIILGLTTSSVITNRQVLGRDNVRTRLNQNLRGSMDIVGLDIRIAGENLPSAFPAVELTNGASGAPDTLTVRRNTIDEVLPICTSISAGSSATSVYFATPGATPGCSYSGQLQSYTAWSNKRSEEGGSFLAYIFNSSTKQGEFFTVTNITDNGTSYYLVSSPHTWTYAYPVGSSSVYVIEEWTYQYNTGMFQVIQNRDTANPFNVAFNILDFQADILMNDGTTKQSFTTSDNWANITTINLNLTGRDYYRTKPLQKIISASFFPRNILSN